jgi:hypothetical protein
MRGSREHEGAEITGGTQRERKVLSWEADDGASIGVRTGGAVHTMRTQLFPPMVPRHALAYYYIH